VATPGIGTVVVYHHPNGYNIPAVVTVTSDSWNAALHTDSSVTQPAAGHVHLSYFTAQGGISASDSTEGTGSGQFSLQTIESEDV
jgi:hypothetical protein